MLKTICVLVAFSASGCAATKAVLKPVCPPSFYKYSAKQQVAAADALKSAAPILHIFLIDYGRMRAELRAAGCRES